MTAAEYPGTPSAKTVRQQRASIRRDIEREHRRAARAKLVALRGQLASARVARKEALVEAKARCRAERVAVRDRARAKRLRVLEELRQALHEERQAARDTCSVRREGAKQTTSSVIQRAQGELEAERAYQEDLKRIERGNRERHFATKRASSTERRSESDDEVRTNIPAELVALFERVKRGIKGSPRETRTEAFLRYAEENPEEVLAILDDKSEAVIRDLERQEREAARYARRRRYTAAELADVPF
jgi:hypothetical protein